VRKEPGGCGGAFYSDRVGIHLGKFSNTNYSRKK
jgi:hypothetical protein